MRSPHGMFPAVGALLAGMLLAITGAAHAAYALPASSPCIVVIGGPPLICLGPAERLRVHVLFPAAIDPTASVRVAAGLPFATAIVIYDRYHRVTTVQYYYGAARAFHTVPPIAARPTFLMVAESPGRLDAAVRFWDAGTPWGHYRGYIRSRNLSLVIFGNVPQAAVHRIVTRFPGTGLPSPWRINRVLTIPQVGNLCAHHASARFIASVHGFLNGAALNGPGGGYVGRLSAQPNPRAFFAGNITPFVQVWGTKAWSLKLSGRALTFHGLLRCDAGAQLNELPGWRASIMPDRYSVVGAPANGISLR